MNDRDGGDAVVMIDVIACDDCGNLDAGSRTLCPACLSDNRRQSSVPGKGTLLTWTTIRKPPAQFDAEGIYTVALVRLDTGIRVTGRLVMDSQDPQLHERVKAIESPDKQTLTFEREKE